MNMLFALIVASTVAFASTTFADAYSTEATLSLNQGKTRYEVAGRVCRLVERAGAVTEEVIASPKVVSSPGSPGSFYVGVDRSNKNYENEKNVSMDVFWPRQAKGGFAVCTITVKQGDTILSKATIRVRVNEK